MNNSRLRMPGIVIESEQGLLDGSTETLLQTIDDFFKETEKL